MAASHPVRGRSHLDQGCGDIHEGDSSEKTAKNGRREQHCLPVAVLARQVCADLDHDLQDGARADGRFGGIFDYHEDRRFALPKIRRTLE